MGWVLGFMVAGVVWCLVPLPGCLLQCTPGQHTLTPISSQNMLSQQDFAQGLSLRAQGLDVGGRSRGGGGGLYTN